MRDIPCFAYEAMLASDLSIVDLRGRTAPAAEAFGADGGLPGIPDSSVAQELKVITATSALFGVVLHPV
jgi:hypothetical protein